MTNHQAWDHMVADTWNEQAESWDRRSIQMWEEGSRKELLPFFERHVDKARTVIDIGCGSGYGSYKLKRAGYTVTGIDLSPKMIDLAERQYGQAGIEFLTANMSDLVGGEDRKFDSALVMNVFEWTKDPLKSLNDLSALLHEAGYLCISIFGPTAGPRQYSYPRLEGKEVVFHTIMPWEFERLATKEHFTIIDEYGVYKEGVTEEMIKSLSKELRQALSFMWVYMLQKR